jgi:hypothetical protein
VTTSLPRLQLAARTLRPAFAARAALLAGLSGVIFAAIIAFRIVQLDEALSERTTSIIIIAAIAGFLTGWFLALVTGWLFWRMPRWLIIVPLLLLLAIALFGAFALCFAIDIRFIHGQLDEAPFTEGWFRELIFSPLGAIGMFLQTGTRYLLPWPVALGAALIAPLLALFLTGRDANRA